MGPKMRGIGWRGLDTRELYFDDVWVPDEHLLGDPDLGLSQFLRTLEVGRISIAALSLSLTQAVLDLATAYARRTGPVRAADLEVPGGAVQARRHRDRARGGAVAHLPGRVPARQPASRSSKEAAMAKLKASRVATWAASEAVQIHGGLGYMLETPVARFYCDAKVLEIGEGHQRDPAPGDRPTAGLLSSDRAPGGGWPSAMSSRSGSQAASSSGA